MPFVYLARLCPILPFCTFPFYSRFSFDRSWFSSFVVVSVENAHRKWNGLHAKCTNKDKCVLTFSLAQIFWHWQIYQPVGSSHSQRKKEIRFRVSCFWIHYEKKIGNCASEYEAQRIESLGVGRQQFNDCLHANNMNTCSACVCVCVYMFKIKFVDCFVYWHNELNFWHHEKGNRQLFQDISSVCARARMCALYANIYTRIVYYIRCHIKALFTYFRPDILVLFYFIHHNVWHSTVAFVACCCNSICMITVYIVWWHIRRSTTQAEGLWNGCW